MFLVLKYLLKYKVKVKIIALKRSYSYLIVIKTETYAETYAMAMES